MELYSLVMEAVFLLKKSNTLQCKIKIIKPTEIMKSNSIPPAQLGRLVSWRHLPAASLPTPLW